MLGDDADIAVGDRFSHQVLESFSAASYFFIDSNEPLQLRQRLNNTAGAFGSGHILGDTLLFFQQPLFFEPINHDFSSFSCFFVFHFAVDGHPSVLIDDLLNGQAVSLADLPVDHAMGRRQADGTGAELLVHAFVSDDLDIQFFAAEFKVKFLTDIFFILPLRVNGNTGVAELCFRTGGGDGDREVLAVTECVKLGRAFLIDNLIVGDGGLTFGVPVYDPVAPVDKVRFIHPDKSGHNRFVSFLIHRIGVTAPVHRSAHRSYLA